MIAKKIIGLTLLASAGIYVAVKKFGKDKSDTSQTPVDPSKVSPTNVVVNPNGGILYSGTVFDLPPGMLNTTPQVVSVNGLNLLN